MRSQFENQTGSQPKKPKNDKRMEGEVRVEGKNTQPKNPSSKSKHYNTSNMGEYVDFEEIKE